MNCVVWLAFVGSVFLFALVLDESFILSGYAKEYKMQIIPATFFFILATCALVIFFIFGIYTRTRCSTQNISTKFKKINLLLYDHHIIVSYKDEKLHFFYFDLRNCISYVKRHIIHQENEEVTVDENLYNDLDELGDLSVGGSLSEQSSETSVMVGDTNGESNLSVKSILFYHIWDYLILLDQEKLPLVKQQRHTIQGMCMCQFVLNQLQNSNDNCTSCTRKYTCIPFEYCMTSK